MTPPLRDIHHVKLPVTDLTRSIDFYTAVFDAHRLTEADHLDDDGRLYAVILRVPGLSPLVELRLDPEQAAAHAGFDPLTLAVDDRAALEQWAAHLDHLGVEHSDQITAIQAWLVVFADPDGTRLRLYTLEQHGPELPTNVDDSWITRPRT
ncbi:VOC family protein [Actinomycetospora termitidis]|uniref:VOC family protein n=1 Tax=Actinomycetospora termitidis TaxID=3053470 RepID=A0ABT7M6P8_9PSEU|nr:VOC family protein [Actinomycetospora sp. Odt1-22]MDL5156213.1 VOC family protein [Actinomycetospora sp. Odt1-22]